MVRTGDVPAPLRASTPGPAATCSLTVSKRKGATNNNIPLAKVNVSLLAHNVGVAAANTLDLRQSILNLALAIHVRVEKTAP